METLLGLGIGDVARIAVVCLLPVVLIPISVANTDLKTLLGGMAPT